MTNKEVVGWSVATVAAIVALFVLGWSLGWWLEEKAVNKESHIFEKSYGSQSAYIEELQRGEVELSRIAVQIKDPRTPASERESLASQEAAVTQQTCAVAARITSSLPETEARFVATHC